RAPEAGSGVGRPRGTQKPRDAFVRKGGAKRNQAVTRQIVEALGRQRGGEGDDLQGTGRRDDAGAGQGAPRGGGARGGRAGGGARDPAGGRGARAARREGGGPGPPLPEGDRQGAPAHRAPGGRDRPADR